MIQGRGCPASCEYAEAVGHNDVSVLHLTTHKEWLPATVSNSALHSCFLARYLPTPTPKLLLLFTVISQLPDRVHVLISLWSEC